MLRFWEWGGGGGGGCSGVFRVLQIPGLSSTRYKLPLPGCNTVKETSSGSCIRPLHQFFTIACVFMTPKRSTLFLHGAS